MSGLLALDARAFEWVNGAVPDALRPAFAWIGSLGSIAGVVLAMIAIALASSRGFVSRGLAASAVGATVLLPWIVTHLLKDLVARSRPSVAVAGAHLAGSAADGSSFPSGHATIAFALAVVLSRRFPAFAAPAFGLAALVAISRVVVGAHYPADVLAGALIGTVVPLIVLRRTPVLRPVPESPRSR